MLKNILIGGLVVLCLSAFTPSTTIDLTSEAQQAKWLNDLGRPLPFPGGPNDARGFVRILQAQLEDGKSYSDVLQTHPRWAAQGAVEGRYHITIPENTSFKAVVGFIQGATGSDGVTFEALWKEGNKEVLLGQVAKKYDGRLSSLNADLLNYGGHSGTLIIRVKAGASSGQDWAVWKSLRIIPVPSQVGAPQTTLRQPSSRAATPSAKVKPQQPTQKPDETKDIQAGQPQQIRRIEATLGADPASYSGSCPATINFRGKISVPDPGQVQYRFIRSDGATAPVQTLDFAQPGSREVSTTWRIGRDYSGWVAIKIISPQEVESDKANFTIKCGAATEPSRLPASQEKAEQPPGRIIAPPKRLERIVPGVETRKEIALAQAPVQLQRRALDFLESVSKTDMAPALKNARLGQKVHPFYRPDLPDVAYYEFEIEPGGYVFLSQGEHDFPVTTWNHGGKSISQKLESKAQRAGKQVAKFYALSDLAFAAEDSTGELVAYIGAPLIRVIGMNPSWTDENMPLNEAIAAPVRTDKGFRYEVPVSERHPYQIKGWDSWNDLKAGYAQEYKIFLDALRREAQEEWELEEEAPGSEFPSGDAIVDGGDWSDWEYWWAGTHEDQRLYYQVEVSCDVASGCGWSGCGATAWAMLFGWVDHQATLGTPTWASNWGIYRQNGGTGDDADAPRDQDEGVANMTKEISGPLDPLCVRPKSDGCFQGATAPRKMDKAHRYLQDRATAPLVLKTKWGTVGVPTKKLAERAIHWIKSNRTPVIIGTGHLSVSHYPLAYGFAERHKETSPGITRYSRWFYINKGWGDETDNGWVKAKVWFVGTIIPTSAIGDFVRGDGFTAGDIDGGNDEIIHASRSNTLAVFDYSGAREREWPINFQRFDGLATGDIDGDGLPEIVHASRDNKITVLDCSGNVKSEFKIDEYEAFKGGVGDEYDWYYGDRLAVGDIDGDGKDEIIHASRDNKITITDFLGAGKGGFQTDFERGDGFAAGDVDGDGRDEIIHGDRDNKIIIYDAAGRKYEPFEINFEEGDEIACGDVDGDGRDEIIHGDRGDKIVVLDYLGNRKSTFQVDFEREDGLAAGDLDGDGRDEIIHADRHNKINIYDSTGKLKRMI